MYRFSPDIVIENLPPLDDEGNVLALDNETLRLRATQKSQLIDRVWRDVYVGRFGLALETDIAYPTEDPSDIDWRMGRIRAAGNLQQAGLQYIGAFQRDPETGEISQDTHAMVGLLVLRASSLCDEDDCDRHRATEIVEWDAFGPKGLGRALLRTGMKGVDPTDTVFADVAKPNTKALEIYDHYGFRLYRTAGPLLHGVFNTYHRRLSTNAGDLRKRLGLAALEA